MGKSERLNIIQKIQDERKSCLITYVTSARQGLDVPMAMDSIRKIYEHLVKIGGAKKEHDIDLFIFSNGGDGTVPWRLVTLIREYAKKFSVIIPYRAFSAATLTALGADAIVMHPMGMLGPTDPTVTNAFNPTSANGQQIGISVEDVTAYISLIKEDVGIRHEDELVQAFNKLAEQVHPLALGNVKRHLSQSRMMAKKLLSLHMDLKDEHKIYEIVDSLTSKLFYHGHPINRDEAKEHVGLLNVEDPTGLLEDLIWELYVEYETEMQMEVPFNPAKEIFVNFPTLAPGETATTNPQKAKLAYIESEKQTNVMLLDYHIFGAKQVDGSIAANTIVNSNDWKLE